MIGRYSKGSYLGATPTAPSMYSASGMWSLSSASRYRVEDEWPPLLTPPEPPVVLGLNPLSDEQSHFIRISWSVPASQHPIVDYLITATDNVGNSPVQFVVTAADAIEYLPGQLQLSREMPSGGGVYGIQIAARSVAGYGENSQTKYSLTFRSREPQAPTITSITVSETV